MLRLVIAAGFFLQFSLCSLAQLKKFYTVKEACNFDTVEFTLKAARGNSYIKNYKEIELPMVIYGNPDLDKINPSFNTRFSGKTCYAKLALETYNSFQFGDGISFIVDKKPKEEDGNYWKILVGDSKIYRFYMKYGVGSTEVDLSNVKTNKLWLSSGSANVKVGYDEGERNLIPMDTFFVKVDMGTLETYHLGNARAANFIADIGFGTATLDFRGKESQKVRCDAKVGAGSLDVVIPSKDTPVIIYLKDSPFCGIRMEDDFEEVEDNVSSGSDSYSVYVNHSYSAQASDLITLDVDVALGTLSISYFGE